MKRAVNDPMHEPGCCATECCLESMTCAIECLLVWMAGTEQRGRGRVRSSPTATPPPSKLSFEQVGEGAWRLVLALPASLPATAGLNLRTRPVPPPPPPARSQRSLTSRLAALSAGRRCRARSKEWRCYAPSPPKCSRTRGPCGRISVEVQEAQWST